MRLDYEQAYSDDRSQQTDLLMPSASLMLSCLCC